jgi:L-alanine-DL-glutamate epimerase-like enolase superfamily enzyme
MSSPRHARRAAIEIRELALAVPFRITGHLFVSVPVAIVEIAQDGFVGRGEAAGVYYCQDRPADMRQPFEALRADLEAGLGRGEVQQRLPPGGLRNAIDCALWDLQAKLEDVAAWTMAGLRALHPVVTTYSLGADTPAAMVARSRSLPTPRALKLKLTGDSDDAGRVRAIRAAWPEVWIGVDANQGLTVESFRALLPALVEAGVALVEQPLPVGMESAVRALASPIPIAADESIRTLADMKRLGDCFDVVNIKLDKCGGLTEALAMVEDASRRGLDLMVGNMVGTALAMAPAMIIAQHCDFVDLDGPLALAADCTPGAQYRDGTIWCPEALWGWPVARGGTNGARPTQ